MKIMNTLIPYDKIDYEGIEYGTCIDYDHVSRYRKLRTVVHNPNESCRFTTLETSNLFSSNLTLKTYQVKATEEDRLDIIANNLLGSARYSWVLAYFNSIEDGFTVKEGMLLKYPASVSMLFQNNEILSSVPATMLNLGSE